MPQHDLAIINGRVVLDGGCVEHLNIGVADERITTLTSAPVDAEQIVDAEGLVVLPGVVDEHFHVFRGYPWETYEGATRAAAKGGVTSVIDMPLDQPPTLTAPSLREKLESIAGSCHVDYATFGGYLAEDPDEMTAMVEAGAICFKLFTGGVAPPGMYPGVDDGQILDAFRRAAALGATVTVHGENAAIVDHETERLMAEGRKDLAAWDDARPWYSETSAAYTIALLAEVTGARVVVAHASSPQTVEAVATVRARGADVRVETCHHYLCTSKADAARDERLKWNPPTRGDAEVRRLWELVAAGHVDAVGSDHAPLPNVPGADVWSQVPGAGNAVETMLPVFATQAVHEHGMSLSRVADMLATTPAKTFRLYPRKGAIRVGADADLAIVEADGAKTLDGSQLEYHDQEPWSPFDGMTLRVYPVYTILRGKVIFAEGAVQGRPGDGRHLRAAEPALA